MKPVLALVGRPNVGKSTLFNRMTKSRDAIVADFAGLTRDRHYGDGRLGEREYIVIDTGGFEPTAESGIYKEMAKQTRQAVAEADAVVFVVDARSGVSGQDHDIARFLRTAGKKVLLAVNKAEGMRDAPQLAEFHELGIGEPLGVSAAHGEGVRDLVDIALARVPLREEPAEPPESERRVRVAIVGRPNVGKSTLVNALLGEERVIAFDQPGTTRDSIALDFERDGKRYTIVDTAGVRRQGKVIETAEKFSVIKTMQAIDDANVVVLMLDAEDGVTEQDAHLAGHVLEAGRALVLAINKWDAAAPDARELIKREIGRKLQFLEFATQLPISAREGRGLPALITAVDAA